jgi:hypothetical protein
VASGDTLLIFEPKNNDPPASAYATLDTRNSHPVLDFDGATDEEAVFPFILPRNYAGGGVTVAIHFMMTSATSGTIRFQTAFERCNDGGHDLDADSFASFNSGGETVPGTTGQIGVTEIAHTHGGEMDSVAVGEGGRFKVRRDADGTSGTDDVATDLELFRIEIRET